MTRDRNATRAIKKKKRCFYGHWKQRMNGIENGMTDRAIQKKGRRVKLREPVYLIWYMCCFGSEEMVQ